MAKGVLVDVCDGLDVAEPIEETDGVVDTVFDKDEDVVGELLGEDELLRIDVVVAEILAVELPQAVLLLVPEELAVELLVAVPDTVEDTLDVEVDVSDKVEVAVPDNVACADEVSLEVASLDIVG